mmetsp:Transcript_20307/g.77755  ORF Transcript_20307/g.77755 Transcript_20307/m.77755 type:complete len:208 (-) Transcript_20307:114-737(-)|eukprot:CAMPEP_0114613260 /NCGR_PEP_ID=MMETSP0168-20121206/5040_1 /TAXON_ID=95228 ORGANISM="Vannella sp., Strain DIVA3 517/6/12" /NCGR_SAMPLE_ID=MMETSP0168 /ASSEMBLY_ACC=CAM_ASM_000044 /LENGTH=207 /DNA_ID=CAMNT_0001824259 /DNA_START=72 /DNA_END=695 /DNA_ORIENTATION=-
MPEHKMCLLGIDNVGKTSLAVRFLQGAFIGKYDPTIEDSYRKNVQISGVHYLVEILDMAGKEQLTAMGSLQMKDSQGFIFVFSIDNRKSFEKLKEYRAGVEEFRKNNEFPSLLVGNKADLEDKRQVSEEEAIAWANEFPRTSYVEVSAKLQTNVDDIFQQLLQNVLEYEAKRAKEPQSDPAADPVPHPEDAATTKSKGKKDKDCVIQ